MRSGAGSDPDSARLEPATQPAIDTVDDAQLHVRVFELRGLIEHLGGDVRPFLRSIFECHGKILSESMRWSVCVRCDAGAALAVAPNACNRGA